jgi:hypothetical protein
MRNFFSLNRINLLIFYLISVLPFVAFLAKGLNIEGLLQLLMMALIFFMFILKGSLSFPRYLVYLLFFFIYVVLSDVFLASARIDFKYVYTSTFLGSVVYLIIIENLSIPQEDYKRFFKISLIVLYIAFLVLLIQQFINPFFFSPPEMDVDIVPGEDRRPPSIYGWIGSSALLGVCFFPVLSIIIEDSFRESKKSLYIIFLFFMGALVSLFSRSRFVMVNFLLLLFLIPIYKGFRLNTFIRISSLVVASAFALYFGAKAVNYDIDKLITERILESNRRGGMVKGSAGTRIVAFEVFGKLFPKHPIWGKGFLHGFGRRGSHDFELVKAIAGRSSQIHVGYLSLFYYYGLFGGGIYVLFLISLTRKLRRDAKLHGRWGPLIGWIMFLVSNLTLVMLHIYIMGLMIIFLFNQYYIQEAKHNLELAQAHD